MNKEKLIIMTKLAIYDKKYGESDRRYDSYFRGDYVYKHNFWNRFFALLGCLIIVSLYYTHKIVVGDMDIFSIDYKQELTNIVIFIVVVLSIYTVIGSIAATVKYYLAQRRLKRYFVLISKIKELSRETDFTEEDISEDYGTDIVYSRKRD